MDIVNQSSDASTFDHTSTPSSEVVVRLKLYGGIEKFSKGLDKFVVKDRHYVIRVKRETLLSRIIDDIGLPPELYICLINGTTVSPTTTRIDCNVTVSVIPPVEGG